MFLYVSVVSMKKKNNKKKSKKLPNGSQGHLLVGLKDFEIEKSIKWNFVCYSRLLTARGSGLLQGDPRELKQRACM